MIESSNITTGSDPSKSDLSKEAAEDSLLKLQLDESDIPEISIDVSKVDVTFQDEKAIEKTEKLNNAEECLDVNDTETANTSKLTLSSKSKSNNFVWVSNLRHGIKATDIKKFFSQIGKVTSVKVLTNGKNFYGYVSMETQELTARCISDLNESLFQGDKIIVSKKRPDITDLKAEKTKKKIPTKKVDNIKENKLEKDSATDKSELPPENKDKPIEIRNDKRDSCDHLKQQQQMQTKIDSLNYTNKKLKLRLDDLKRMYDGMCKKYHTLKEDLNKMKFQSRQDQRRLDQEKESFEKSKKIEISKIDADKATTNKEMIEIRKLKESLRQKLNDARFESRKPYKRERSPLTRPNKSTRRRISPMPRNGGFYRDEQRTEGKKFRRGPSRERTPPPPNLTVDLGKKRNELSNIHITRPPYYSQNVKSQVPAPFDYRQNRMFPSYPLDRGSWLGHPRNLRRTNSNHSHGSNPDGRFNGPVDQHPASDVVVVAPRPPHGSYYYPQW